MTKNIKPHFTRTGKPLIHPSDCNYPRIDLVGTRIGYITVLEFWGRNKYLASYWACRCDCGTEFVSAYSPLYNKTVKSCGCYNSRCRLKRNHKHGFAKTDINGTYETWKNMKRRCLKTSSNCYKYYGGRGISIHEEWVHDFNVFLNHVGCKPSTKHRLDRIDNNGNYEPGNVRWVTHAVNMQNSRVAKMDATKVLKLRALCEAGSYTFKHLAHQFGISNVQVSNIVNRKSWKNI